MQAQEFFSQNKKFFFDDAFIIGEYVKRNHPQIVTDYLAAADDVAEQKITFTRSMKEKHQGVYETVQHGEEIDWLYQSGDDPEYVWSLNRMVVWQYLGQAYGLTKDEKYAKAFTKQMSHWVKNYKNTPANAQAWRSIDAGLRLGYWCKALYCFKNSPSITEDIIDLFIESVNEHCEYIMTVWDSFNLISNWGVLAYQGMFIAAAMIPETPRTKVFMEEAIRRLTENIKIQIYRDGSHWEQSTRYQTELLHFYLDVLIVAGRNKIVLPEIITTKVNDMCLASMHIAKPDHIQPLMGDSDEVDIRYELSKAAILFHNSGYKAESYTDTLGFDAVWNIGEEGIAIYNGIQARAPQELSFFQPDSGNAYMRESWSENTTWAHFQCGPLGAGHGHADKLHFDIFSRGEDVLMDAGRYTYAFTEDRKYFKSLAAHNTIKVDDRDLYLPLDSWLTTNHALAVNQKFYADHNYCYTSGGHLGYIELEHGVYLNRKFIYLKPDVFVIADEYFTSGTHKYEQYLHFNNIGSLSKGDDSSWLYEGKQVNAQILFSGNEYSTSIIDTKIARNYGHYTDAKGITTAWNATGCGCFYTFVVLSDKEDKRTFSLEKIAVEYVDSLLEDSEMEAFHIRYGDMFVTLMIGHKEFISKTEAFRADGCTALGNVIAFDRSKNETVGGTVLLW